MNTKLWRKLRYTKKKKKKKPGNRRTVTLCPVCKNISTNTALIKFSD